MKKIIALVILVIAILGVWGWQQKDKPVEVANVATSTDMTGDPAAPYIESIIPSAGPIGTVVEIGGRNLSGFEGDLDVYFERSDGKRVLLLDSFGSYQKSAGNLIKVIVKEPCQQGDTVYGAYSGIPAPCDYVKLTPGVYKVYTMPWGKKSNVVTFTIRPKTVPISDLLPTSKLVTFPELGVKMNVSDNLVWEKYSTSSVSFSTRELEAISNDQTGIGCQRKYAPLGLIARVNKVELRSDNDPNVFWTETKMGLDEMVPKGLAKEFSTFYIYYVGPQSSCGSVSRLNFKLVLRQ
jgi:hypothetical protein